MGIRHVPYGSPSRGRLIQSYESDKEEVTSDGALGTGDAADNEPPIDEVEVISGDGREDEVVLLTFVQLPQVTTVT